MLAFFAKRPRLAATPAGRAAVLRAQWRLIKRLQVQVRSLQSAQATPEGAIRHVFGGYAEQALRVAACESGYSVWAQNGRYLGLFQMGSSERSTYGHGSTPLEQARAAYAYFVASGRDWSPWACKPW